MRKLLSWLTTFTVITTSATSVTACSSDYNDFKTHIDNKETFVYFVGAKDCPNCQNSQDKMWWHFAGNKKDNSLELWLAGQIDPNQSIQKFQDKKLINESEAASLRSMHFYNYEVDKVNNVDKDGDVKKIQDYVVDQVKNEFEINGKPYKNITAQQLGITGVVPLFLYFSQGKFEGYTTNAITTVAGMTDNIYNHIVKKNWVVNPIQ